jgi:hypothetical protein
MTNKQIPEALRLAASLRQESEKTSSGVKYSTAKNSAKELERQHAAIERLRAEVEGLQAENNVLCEALSAYIMFKNDARIIEGNFHWLPDGESVEEIIDAALQSTKEQP